MIFDSYGGCGGTLAARHDNGGDNMQATDDFEGIEPGGDLAPEDGDGVDLVRNERGAYFVPVGWDLDPRQAVVVQALQESAVLAARVREQMRGDVAIARRVGLSWQRIGFCLGGLSGEAVRKRYGVDV
jgi:hypothetical protein